MLILTRRISESIIIGDDEIKITIVNVKGNQVRVGIQADRKIPIHREEIKARIDREKKYGKNFYNYDKTFDNEIDGNYL